MLKFLNFLGKVFFYLTFLFFIINGLLIILYLINIKKVSLGFPLSIEENGFLSLAILLTTKGGLFLFFFLYNIILFGLLSQNSKMKYIARFFATYFNYFCFLILYQYLIKNNFIYLGNFYFFFDLPIDQHLFWIDNQIKSYLSSSSPSNEKVLVGKLLEMKEFRDIIHSLALSFKYNNNINDIIPLIIKQISCQASLQSYFFHHISFSSYNPIYLEYFLYLKQRMGENLVFSSSLIFKCLLKPYIQKKVFFVPFFSSETLCSPPKPLLFNPYAFLTFISSFSYRFSFSFSDLSSSSDFSIPFMDDPRFSADANQPFSPCHDRSGNLIEIKVLK